MLSLKVLEKSVFLLSSSLLAILDVSWLIVASNFCLCLHMVVFSLCVSVSSNLPLLIRHQTLDFGHTLIQHDLNLT